MNLTNRQQELLDYLRDCYRRTGLMPSTREIQAHFEFSSQTAAMSHLKALERKGAIRRLAGKARAVIFPDEVDRPEILQIPIYGHIAAGMASAATQDNMGSLAVDISTLDLPRNSQTFALKVRGDSMINAQISDGDYVILEYRQPHDRDIVAALIDQETTLKRYVLRQGRPYLKAENPDFPDLIPAQELIVQGVMVGLIRRVVPSGSFSGLGA